MDKRTITIDTVPICPPWCTAGDHGGDPVGERAHWSDSLDVPLSLEPPAVGMPGPQQPALMATLIDVEGNDQDVHVILGDTALMGQRRLTLAEAAQLANRLRALIAQAHHKGTSTAPAPGCEPWCTDHYDGDGIPEDGYCRRRAAGGFADVYLSDDLDGHPMIFSYQQTRDEQTPAEARAYALELLALADAVLGVAA
ncbi:DUF6907 domain-containing protein [Streptosporangium saharense]|uniref:DUF6907 domain-containing protein n=1 Tax=Streptosporangium saharense TaxID=1706840 RepID=UPI0034421D58